MYTDHKPPHGVFQKDIFDLASPRLQRLREKVAMFSFDVRWVPGKTHLIADALSRAPLFAAEDLPGLKNILRKSGSSGADADCMLYEWRNVPRSDGYSPAQLLFGRAQRISLPTLPSQNKPINFESAASSKDAAHARSKLDHDR